MNRFVLIILLFLNIVSLRCNAQITLNKFRDKHNSEHVESVLFNYSDSRGARENKKYDIQENNSFNNLDYKAVGIGSNGSSIYHAQDLVKTFDTLRNLNFEYYADYIATSLVTVTNTEKFVIVSYELITESEYDIDFFGSVLRVLNSQGDLVLELEGFATHGLCITSNGHYLAGFRGNQSEALIYNVLKKRVHYKYIGYVNSCRSFNEMIFINAPNNRSYAKYILDSDTGNVYKFKVAEHETFRSQGYNQFEYKKESLSFSDFERIK